jgi:plastocyanin domain-containing protein
MNTLIVNILGLSLIAFIVGWFWLYRPKTAARPTNSVIDIHVDNGVYSPSDINIPLHQATILRFIREDKSPCAETVIFDGLDISENLPVNQSKAIRITPSSSGTFEFHCPMNMYKGRLHVT